MAAHVTRDLKITYDGLLMGSTSDYLIDGPFVETIGPNSAAFEWEVVVSKTSEADFLTAVAALEAKFKLKRKDLLIELGSAARHTFAHSTASGFNSEPSLSKMGSEDDTGLTARFKCGVVVGLPGTNVNTDGRQDSHVLLSKDASGLWTVTIRGTYTGTAAQPSARTVALAAVPVYALTVLPSGSFDPTLLEVEPEDADRVASFTTIWKEVFFNENGSTLDDSGLVDQRLVINKAERSGELSASGDARPAVEYTVAYETNVDRAVHTSLSTVWTGKVYPHLLTQVRTLSGSSRLAVMEADPGFNLAGHRIAAHLRVLVFESSLLFHEVTTTDEIDRGLVDVHVWNGNPYARDVKQGPASHVRTVLQSTVRIGKSGRTSREASSGGATFGPVLFYPPDSGNDQGSSGDAAAPEVTFSTGAELPKEAAGASSFIERRRRREVKNYVLGLATGRIDLGHLLEEVVYTRADDPNSGGGGSGGGGARPAHFLTGTIGAERQE